jgi:DNA-binding LacI/PurR family transcriptional regulator
MPGDYSMTDMPFFRNSLMGVVEVVSSRGYDVIVTLSHDKDISNLERVISNHKVDGVILLRTIMEDPAVSYLKEKGVPFVVLGSVPDCEVTQVDSNHKEACKEMTSILLMKGMRKIALIGGNEMYTVTQNRLAGFVEAYSDMKIPLQEDLIYQNAESRILVEKAINEIMTKDIDGIMCMDDTICEYVLNKFDRDGVKVPEDVRVASFYSSTILENHVPSITTLKFDVKELGRACGKLLLGKLEGEQMNQTTILGYEVVLKESTK